MVGGGSGSSQETSARGWKPPLSPDDIVPNAHQPRSVFDPEDLAELVHSVREFGVLQPIVVRPHPDAATA